MILLGYWLVMTGLGLLVLALVLNGGEPKGPR